MGPAILALCMVYNLRSGWSPELMKSILIFITWLMFVMIITYIGPGIIRFCLPLDQQVYLKKNIFWQTSTFWWFSSRKKILVHFLFFLCCIFMGTLVSILWESHCLWFVFDKHQVPTLTCTYVKWENTSFCNKLNCNICLFFKTSHTTPVFFLKYV